MIRIRPVPVTQADKSNATRVPAEATGTSPEHAAILAGVLAGDAALARRQGSGVLIVFMELRQSEAITPRLMALRSYAELRRVLLSEGYGVPASSLLTMGFTLAQIARFDRAIATIPRAAGTTFTVVPRQAACEVV